MRISEQQAQVIVGIIAEVLPDTKHILLYGSRVGDLLKGYVLESCCGILPTASSKHSVGVMADL